MIRHEDESVVTGGGCMKARVIVVLAVVLASFVWASTAQAQLRMPDPVDEAIVDALREDLAKASQFYSDNDAAAADRLFDKALASPGFAVLEPGERYRTLLRAGGAALDLNAPRKAHPLLVRSCGFDEAEGIAWHMRLRAAYMIDDHVDSANSVAFIARRWPQALDQVRERAIFDISNHLGKSAANRDARMAMLTALFDANWTNEGRQPSWLWKDLVRFLVETGDMPRATEVAARIDAPEIILAFRVDKRFDGLVRARSGGFDIERVMKREREHIGALREQHPKRLSHIVDALELDVRDGHAGRALALADEVIARVAADGMAAYTDSDDHYIWVLNSRARALTRLGRWDDAVAQFRKAARRPENGGMNVSQVLNLARLLARLERPDDVEEAMEELGGMSPFGRMQLALNRVMAAAAKGDAAALDAQLAAMRADRTESMGTYQAALVQADRIDEAAALLIERLRSDDWRSDALEEMQTYADVAQAPRDTLHIARWRAILERQDVQDALDAVGRIERVPFANPLL
jgi:tetratricopeptide (TPR) repeat protein